MLDLLPFHLPGFGVLSALLAAGLGAGILGGLLGIGGGVVIVPVLLEVFAAEGIAAEVRTPLAIGTAHAAVLLASVSAARAHARAGRVDGALLRGWLPPMLAGTAAGLLLVRIVAPALLVGVFALVALLLGLSLLAGERAALAERQPPPPLSALPPALVGTLAAALGVGGGTLSGPTLALFSVPLVRVIGAGAVFNIAVALPATLAFVWSGLGNMALPAGTLGYVTPVPLVALTVPAFLVAPWAARLAPRLPLRLLRRLFAACLLAIALRMLLRLLG
ncbi:TSUP family transporter [Falsiroseomonas sp.]|uniref:TSUP family transporter n=1 Tax=Falsiroseomonas sp. TaxID=2870721 RepID=UPI003567016D